MKGECAEKGRWVFRWGFDPCPRRLGGPKYADDGRANGSSWAYAKEVDTAEMGLSEVVRMEARRRSPEGVGARGVEGAGRVKVKV